MPLYRQVSRDYDNLRQENAKLREQVTKCHKLWLAIIEWLTIVNFQAKEGEQTLEELGQQLSWSKLQVKIPTVNNKIENLL